VSKTLDDFKFAFSPTQAADILSLSSARAPSLDDWPPEQLSQMRVIFRKLTSMRIVNPEDAEDVVQETFVTMAEKFPCVRLQKGLLVWGMGILRRKVGNYYRRANRTAGLDQKIMDACILRVIQAQPSPESHTRRAELQTLVQSLVRELPPRERIVMDLVLAGLATHEIVALHYPEPYQNITNRIHRARRRLLRRLAKYGYRVHSRRERRGRKPTGGASAR
jgi:RNA polymerase sigma factor (sigma-70 family)